MFSENPFWDYKKHIQNKETELLDEGLMDFLKSVFDRFSSFIKSLTNKLGTKKSISIDISVPEDLFEVRKEGTGGSRKDIGSLVEVQSVIHFGKRLEAMGFDVSYGLNGQGPFSSNKPLTDYASYLTDKIYKGIDVELANPDIDEKRRYTLQKKRDQVPDNLQRLENYGIATADRLENDIKSSKIYPLIQKVFIEAGGQAGTGSTKSDINIEYSTYDENEVASLLERSQISHKYNQQKAFGEQGTYLSVLTSVLGLGNKKVDKEEMAKQFAAAGGFSSVKEAAIHLTEFGNYIGTKAMREANPKEYEQVSLRYYQAVKKLVEKNYLNIIKMAGIEKDVEHFFVNHDKKSDTFTSYYSKNSKKYTELYEYFYNETLKKDIRVKVVANVKSVEIEYLWKNTSIFKTSIHTFESNTNKVVHVGGLSTDIFNDAVRTGGLKEPSTPPKLKSSTDVAEFKRFVKQSKSKSKDVTASHSAARKLMKYSEKNDIDVSKLSKREKIEMVDLVTRGKTPKEVFDWYV